MLARLAELEEVILFIKGPTAVLMGLGRRGRPVTSTCCASPAAWRSWGRRWRRAAGAAGSPSPPTPTLCMPRSTSSSTPFHYIHDEWPCDLDIHYTFPGFLAPDEVVFEALWKRRATVRIAHWPVPCADFFGQATIVGLHSLRDQVAAHIRRPGLPLECPRPA